jgi:hypothetical protein
VQAPARIRAAEDLCRPNDHGRRVASADDCFTLRLARTVRRSRSEWVTLEELTTTDAVEHRTARDVHQSRPGGGAQGGHVARQHYVGRAQARAVSANCPGAVDDGISPGQLTGPQVSGAAGHERALGAHALNQVRANTLAQVPAGAKNEQPLAHLANTAVNS